jgi:hypothetical protein
MALVLAVTLSTDPAVARALALLGNPPASIAIIVVHPVHGPSALTGGVIGAWTDRRSAIFVSDSSDPYRLAQHGNAVELAALLAHELWHVAHGPAEAPAYAEQVRILRALGASRRAIRHVEEAARSIQADR